MPSHCHPGVSILLATNLPPERYSALMKAYRLRWQVELLFKEWKSYANRDYMDVMLLGGTGRTGITWTYALGGTGRTGITWT